MAQIGFLGLSPVPKVGTLLHTWQLEEILKAQDREEVREYDELRNRGGILPSSFGESGDDHDGSESTSELFRLRTEAL